MVRYTVDVSEISDKMKAQGELFLWELLKQRKYPMSQEGEDLFRLHAKMAIDEITKKFINDWKDSL